MKSGGLATPTNRDACSSFAKLVYVSQPESHIFMAELIACPGCAPELARYRILKGHRFCS